MGTFTLVVSAVPNAPKRPLIFPCYHCQIAQFRIPVKHQVQNSPLLTPHNSKLLLQQKLEDFHYHYHWSEIETLHNYTPSAPSSTSTAVLSTTFFTRLGDIWLANLEILGTFLVAFGTSDVSVSARLNLLSEHLKLHQTLWVEDAENLMPRYQEDDRHYVNFLWNSPGNGILYFNKIVWNGYGDPIKLFGYNFQNVPPSDICVQVYPHTPNWTSLYWRLSEYQHLYIDNPLNEHVFGELVNYLAMSIE